MRSRAEPFGAWVRVDEETLVGVSRAGARRLGIDGGALWDEEKTPPISAPLEVHLAVTARCGAGCEGCYVDAQPDGDVPSFAVLVSRFEAVAKAGVFTVAFGGGEPLTRPDLGELAREARRLDLIPVVTTSGIGLHRERARSLRSFAQVNVSYDGQGADFTAVRGYDGSSAAERTMAMLREEGVPFGVNVVLTSGSFEGLGRTLERAEALGAREAQLLRYKPAGRARGLDYLAKRLRRDQVARLYPTLERLALERPGLSLRVDCALVPLLGAGELDVERLQRFGVFGCEAGRHLTAGRVDGDLAPCSFGPSAKAPLADGFSGSAWAEAEILEAWRALPDAEPCRSCSLCSVCRGGCKVVSEHLEGRLGPDPECPRVLRHREASVAEG